MSHHPNHILKISHKKALHPDLERKARIVARREAEDKMKYAQKEANDSGFPAGSQGWNLALRAALGVK